MLEAVSELSLIQVVILAGMGASAFCYVVALVSAHEFFDAEPRHPAAGRPVEPVSILKPLHGPDVGLYENLAALCRQNYRKFEIICGVANGDDPAAGVVRRVQRDFPNVDISLVVDGRIYGANYKVSNLINVYRRAEYDVIVVADSDIHVGTNYLRHMVAELEDPQVGLATCVYRAVNRGHTPTLIESLFINTDFTPLVMMARKVEKLTYAFGATIAIRRSVLEEIGGFAPMVNSLGDDYLLGNRVSARGYRLALSNEVVDTVLALGSWHHLFQHQLRWARTYRLYRPGGYFGSILTHGTFWALANLLYNHFSPIAWATSAVVIGARYVVAGVFSWHHLKTETAVSQMLLVGAKDLFATAVWFLAFAGDTVEWGGNRFRVDRFGEMTDLAATESSLAWNDVGPKVEETARIAND